MHSVIPFAAFAALASAAPAVIKRDYPTGGYSDFSPDGTYFPLKSDNFPNPNTAQLGQIQDQAHGTLPNGAAPGAPPPPPVSEDGITNLQFIAFNEIFEVAFYSELLYNLTNAAPDYDTGYVKAQEYMIDAIKGILAQEELHALNANNGLAANKKDKMTPCKYSFPVTNFQEAIALAATFTDVVLGTLQDINQKFAIGSDFGLVRAVSSVIGNEGEQEGFFRLINSKRPSSQPFLTTSDRRFAFTAIKSFVVPGSCSGPAFEELDKKLTTFLPLAVNTTDLKAKDQNLCFSVDLNQDASNDFTKYSVVYINQQNRPIVQPIINHKRHGDGHTLDFEAFFPFEQNLLHGLTIAAVVKGQGPFANASAVADAAVFGPGLIELD